MVHFFVKSWPREVKSFLPLPIAEMEKNVNEPYWVSADWPRNMNDSIPTTVGQLLTTNADGENQNKRYWVSAPFSW